MSAAPVAVFVAMDEEAQPFLTRGEQVGETEAVGGALLRTLRIDGRDVLLVTTGIGLVNNATAAAVVASRGAARAFVSAGSAGGLAHVRVGDVVVGDDHTYSRADARAFGYAMGQVPRMPVSYRADPGLVAAAAAGSGGLTVRVGAVVSGDTFVDGTLVDEVRRDFPAAVVTDMESTALAQTAFLFGIPFVSVRAISDLCGAGEFDEHLDHAADRSAEVVVALLRRMG